MLKDVKKSNRKDNQTCLDCINHKIENKISECRATMSFPILDIYFTYGEFKDKDGNE